jgi:hypothetical protein
MITNFRKCSKVGGLFVHSKSMPAQGTHESYEVRMPEAAENSNLQVSSDSKSRK